MSEKTPVNNKRIILLRSLSVMCVVALLVCVVSFPVSAASIDYMDYIVDVSTNESGEDIVKVDIPLSAFGTGLWRVRNESTGVQTEFNGHSLQYNFTAGVKYRLQYRPMIDNIEISLADIPVGTTVTFICDTTGSFTQESGHTSIGTVYYRRNGASLSSFETRNYGFITGTNNYMFALNYPSDATEFRVDLDWRGQVANSSGNQTIACTGIRLTMKISGLYLQQVQSGKTNKILAEVEKQLESQGKTLEEVLEQQAQTNDQLADVLEQQQQTNDQLSTLPGEIGDEIQGVIDKEEQEAEGSGNDFVDQILDMLPDPSTGVLGALRGLTDATSYTGTDAVLTIPAIVLPGIDGLFPTTEIWGGTRFDFGEYIGLLPPALLTLVQCLFTIAMVLFCVYELKGIISYCLTLRANKGG